MTETPAEPSGAREADAEAGAKSSAPAGRRLVGLRRTLWLTYNTLLPLALVPLIMIPLLPKAVFGEVPSKLAQAMKKISVVQVWNMYAPDPQRGHTYLALYAEFADGRRVALAEAEQAARAWTTTWAGRKRRVDVWRFYAVMNPNKQNLNRTWYMRSVCVREALARGEVPTRIVAESVRRRLTPPDRVRAGHPTLGPIDRKQIGTIDCRTWPVREMIVVARSRETGE